MSNEPIALGGSGAIALGGPIVLGSNNTPLDSTNTTSAQNSGNGQTNGANGKNLNQFIVLNWIDDSKKPSFRFVDEVKIGDETLVTIPVENIFYEENNQKKRKSRWGERAEVKKSLWIILKLGSLYLFYRGPSRCRV